MRDARLARGERVLGRKIGFTNRTIWAEFGVDAPMWGYLYDRRCAISPISAHPKSGTGRTTAQTKSMARFRWPALPSRASSLRSFSACRGAAARHGRGRFDRLHRMGRARLRAGAVDLSRMELRAGRHRRRERPARRAADRAAPSGRRTSRGRRRTLASFDIDLKCDGAPMDRGRGGNVMDGPLFALATRSTFWRTTAPIHRSPRRDRHHRHADTRHCR